MPKPQVKARPNQYNSYEVASQLSPIVKPGTTELKSPTQTQNMDVIDLKKTSTTTWTREEKCGLD